MASINSLMSSTSSTSSIYGNSNIISGLASGMDTESMIENAVSGIKNKIAGFNQDMTVFEWEQTAYRDIIGKMADFSTKYMSFSSNTNLLSSAFFDSATKITTTGTYANKLAINGATKSDIEILAATKATTASYSGISKVVASKENFNVKLTMAELGLLDSPTEKKDENGETVMGEDEKPVMVEQTKKLTMTVGGEKKEITVSSSDTVESVLNKMSKEMGVDASYSTTTGKFYLKSKESGAAGDFTIGDGTDTDLATSLFGKVGAFTIGEGDNAQTITNSSELGEDATLTININGEKNKTIKQANNVFDIDGMKITVNDGFDMKDGDTAVTFESQVDTDKIVGAIKSMVEDYNKMANEIKDAYTTKPLTNSSGKRYKPLTEEDTKDMSDEAVKRYEEKAKKGLLFADSNLSSMYSELRYAISDRDMDGDKQLDLEAIGITTAYANGKTTLVLDEDKLRAAVETDLGKVKDVLTREPVDEKDTGGLMYGLQTTLDKYARTTGDKKGVLIELAGSEKAPASISNNTYKGKMDRLQEQIDRWQNKLADKVDYYTRQFTALEKLISEMNSQSSALYGMMGY